MEDIGGTVILRGIEVELDSTLGRAFTEDCCRVGENLTAIDDLLTKYGLSLEAWQLLSQNKAFRKGVLSTREHRTRTGVSAQEAAAKLFAGAPHVLGTILHDQYASSRVRIAAARELRQTAIVGESEAVAANAGATFSIVIDLGADHIARYENTTPPDNPLLLHKGAVDE